MSRNSSIIDFGRAISDGYGIYNSAALLAGGSELRALRIVRRERRWRWSSLFKTPRA
jgi:hypothetical protein